MPKEIDRVLDVMLAAQSRFAQEWRDGESLTVAQSEAEMRRDLARRRLIDGIEAAFKVDVWSEYERDRMYKEFVVANGKHGIFESLFAVGAWLLRNRAALLGMDLSFEALTLDSLSGAAKDVMMQLFVTGPTWDGNVVAKSGRNELVSLGLAQHRNGWAYLTDSGVEMAISANVKGWSDQRWHRKQQTID